MILETETSTKSYDKIDCGGNGFYQVGSSCYTFTFYRSITYKEAAEFCEVREERRAVSVSVNTWSGLRGRFGCAGLQGGEGVAETPPD